MSEILDIETGTSRKEAGRAGVAAAQKPSIRRGHGAVKGLARHAEILARFDRESTRTSACARRPPRVGLRISNASDSPSFRSVPRLHQIPRAA
jgi:hypothetical protein